MTNADDGARARLQALADIFTTALEGGIGYWCVADTYENPEEPGAQRAEVREIDEHTGTPGPALVITLDVIERGLERLASGECTFGTRPIEDVEILRRWAGIHRYPDGGDLDASDADMIVQSGLFGDVRYG